MTMAFLLLDIPRMRRHREGALLAGLRHQDAGADDEILAENRPKSLRKTGITGENICINGGMTRQMIYHGDNGWRLSVME